MSARDFNMVSPTVWRSGRFAKLEQSAKLLFLYVMTSEHQNSAGCYRLPAGYAVEDAGCSVEGFNEDMAAIVAADLVLYDDATKEVFVRDWFQHCPPTNKSHAKGTIKIISRISSDRMRERVEAEFSATQWGSKARDGDPEIPPVDRLNGHLTSTSYMRGRENR